MFLIKVWYLEIFIQDIKNNSTGNINEWAL